MTTTEFRSDYVKLKVLRIVIQGRDSYAECEVWQGTNEVGDVIRIGESFQLRPNEELTIPVSNTITMT